MKRLLVLTGDHSADGHAAAFIHALREMDGTWHVAGVGGVAMANAGIELIRDHRDMNILGVGVVSGMPSHLRLARRILRWADQNKPDVAVLVDYGIFHLWLAPKLRRRGIRVIYFIPPQIWASRPWRLRKLRNAADEVLCILPFEEPYYRSHNINATYVGNPLASRLPPKMTREQFASKHGLDPAKRLIALFPGSRRSEIRTLLAPQIGAAKLLREQMPQQFEFAISKAKNLSDEFFHAALRNAGASELPWLKVVEENHSLLSASDLALLTSGTVTLEAALYQTPMIVMYRGPWYLYLLARLLITVKFISLPNNLAGKAIVPEVLQYRVTPKNIATAAMALLEPPRYEQAKRDLASLAGMLADRQTPRRVAEAIIEHATARDKGSKLSS